jgi:hypothetical protein
MDRRDDAAVLAHLGCTSTTFRPLATRRLTSMPASYWSADPKEFGRPHDAAGTHQHGPSLCLQLERIRTELSALTRFHFLTNSAGVFVSIDCDPDSV